MGGKKKDEIIYYCEALNLFFSHIKLTVTCLKDWVFLFTPLGNLLFFLFFKNTIFARILTENND